MAAKKPTPQQVGGGILAALLLALGIGIVTSQPAPPPPRPPVTTATTERPTTSTSTTTTTAPPAASSVRAFGPTASWNRPVADFGYSPARAANGDRWRGTGALTQPAGKLYTVARLVPGTLSAGESFRLEPGERHLSLLDAFRSRAR